MSFEITGTLYKKFDTVQVNDRFKKREMVLEVIDGSYSQHIKFQMLQDRCSLLDNANEGDEVKLSFNIKGREYNSPKGETMYFTNLDAWRLEKVNANAPAATPAGGGDNMSFPTASDESFSEGTDDLPF